MTSTISVPATPSVPQAARRYDLDSLRVSAFLILVFYHTGMFFVPWGWHIKNPVPSTGAMEVAMWIVAQWRLPLLFLVSGAAVRLALGRRTTGQFVRERFTRLLLPLAFGMLVVVPPQVYFERLDQGAAYASYLAFLPDAFRGVYPEGNLSWHHLWFVAYVFVYALVALPLFRYLRSPAGSRLTAGIADRFAGRAGLLLLGAPVVFTEMLLRPVWPSTHNLLADWANLVGSLLVFVFGYVLYGEERLGAAVERERRTWGVLALLGASVLVVLWRWGVAPEVVGHSAEALVWVGARALNTWVWLLALVGYSRRYLNRPSPALARANEAVYPVYILHQTVIVALGFWLMDWDVAVAAKFVVISGATLLICVGMYLVIRTNPVTRVLFGMKARPVASAPWTRVAVPGLVAGGAAGAAPHAEDSNPVRA
jgi:glucans biosynthesis protein C